MARDNPVSRRTALKITGAAASTALVAGCSGGNGDGNGNGNDNGDDSGPVEIDPDQEITFMADGTTWVGKSPSGIEDVENPTLSLAEGEEYTIGWDENAGSQQHNIAIYNGDGSTHDGLKTDRVTEPEDQTLTFEASSDTVEYVCIPHETSGMKGSIELQ